MWFKKKKPTPWTLDKFAYHIYMVNQANGWFDSSRPFEADIALLHSEVSEAFEAYRKDLGEQEINEELADLFIRLMDTVFRLNIAPDFEEIIKNKMEKNALRGYRHGNRKV